MKAFLALLKIDLKLASRNRAVLFFNYFFPLFFFFVFAQLFDARQGAAILQVVTMVIVIGILGNGLFGAGMRAVQEREENILRRYKVTPITPVPLLVASMITGVVLFVPSVILIVFLAHQFYGMAIPSQWLSLQNLTQFIPATYLMTGIGGIMQRGETLFANWQSVAALLLTTFVATFIATKLFRWEKEEKLRASAKLWVLVVLLPFFFLGAYQAWSRQELTKARILNREFERSRNWLIQNARIFIGNGKVIESGAVLIRKGKIEDVYEGNFPDAKSLNAQAIDAAGKT